MFHESSFTLIELLIAIGILAVLATIAVLALNPQELIKQARDSQRMAGLATLNKALAVYQSSGQTNLGVANTVYISIPSSQSNCSDLGLPILPNGYTYACVASSTLRNINGSGWIPLAFNAVSYGTPLEKLPVDPINSTTTRNYYTYVMGGSWELATAMESVKYKMGGGVDKTSKDGGQYAGLYEAGTNLTLLPIDYGDPNLMGYWRFDEIGSTAFDSSGNGNNGTMYTASTTIGDIHTISNCKSGSGCGSFDGMGRRVNIPYNISLSPSRELTLIMWFYKNTAGNQWPLSKWTSGCGAGSAYLLMPEYTVANPYFFVCKPGSSDNLFSTQATPYNQWAMLAATFQDGNMSIYLNNAKNSKTSSNLTTLGTGSLDISIGSGSNGGQFFNGLLDEVRIYSRALSVAEVMAIYNATR